MKERPCRASCQGTDELIVETGISTFPCQCVPFHVTELENKRGEERGDHRAHTPNNTLTYTVSIGKVMGA